MAETLSNNTVFANMLKAALRADENYTIAFDMKKVNGHVADGTLYVQDASGNNYKVAVKVESLDESGE